MEWYYVKDGQRHGPVPLEAMKSMLQSGYLTKTDLVWREGMVEWRAARDVPVLSPDNSESTAPRIQKSTGAPTGNYPATVAHTPQPNNIPNYMVPAVLATLFCSLPFGIPAIVYASKVNTLVSQGNIPAAIEASNKAKKWTWIAFCVALVVFFIYFIAGMSEGL